MNPFQLPAKFTLTLNAIPETESQFRFQVVAECEGKHAAFESQSLSAVERVPNEAFDELRSMIGYALASKVLPLSRIPRITIRDGVATVEPEPLNPEPYYPAS